MTEQEINKILGSKEYFSKTGTEQEKGTGLGLLLCKEFIQRNGGDITIKSSAGEGTEVCFTLSLAEHHSIPALAIER
jgi:signal transduction histidine kinase